MQSLQEFFNRVTEGWGWVALKGQPELAYFAFLTKILGIPLPPHVYSMDKKWEWLFQTAWNRQLLLPEHSPITELRLRVALLDVDLEMAKEIPLAQVIGNDEAFAWIGIRLDEVTQVQGIDDFLMQCQTRYYTWVKENIGLERP